MKRIGVLGGTSWPSTIDYYKLLNELVSARLGGFHSADLILRSIDYHSIKSCYAQYWGGVAPQLKMALLDLVSMKPDLVMIANNTLHKALDTFIGDAEFADVHFIHIAREIGQAAADNGYKRLLLLGTKLTMEDGYYEGVLENEFALDVEIPNLEDRDLMQSMQTRIAAGDDIAPFKDDFRDMITRYDGFDAVVPACTELPLVVKPDITDLPILNPSEIQCRAAVEFALSS